MAVFHKCDKCGREIDLENEKIHKINYRVSVVPRINDEDLNAKLTDNLDGLEFHEECAKEILLKLLEPINNHEKTLGL